MFRKLDGRSERPWLQMSRRCGKQDVLESVDWRRFWHDPLGATMARSPILRQRGYAAVGRATRPRACTDRAHVTAAGVAATSEAMPWKDIRPVEQRINFIEARLRRQHGAPHLPLTTATGQGAVRAVYSAMLPSNQRLSLDFP